MPKFRLSALATIQTYSDLLGVGVRTLQRALDAEGAGFTEFLNRVRMQLSGQYLANPNMRVPDVADRLGFSSTGAFTRWHHQMYGVPPKARRKSPFGKAALRALPDQRGSGPEPLLASLDAA
jgi:AraC-like DNA-binding protein